jgi:hypothetical protein
MSAVRAVCSVRRQIGRGRRLRRQRAHPRQHVRIQGNGVVETAALRLAGRGKINHQLLQALADVGEHGSRLDLVGSGTFPLRLDQLGRTQHDRGQGLIGLDLAEALLQRPRRVAVRIVLAQDLQQRCDGRAGRIPALRPG